MPVAKVGDINLYYEVHGKGEPLVLITGYCLNCAHWYAIQGKLAREFSVIIFDNRGNGRSDKPDMPYTAAMMAGDVAGLLDVLGIGAANVLGYSMGGMIAQEFALGYPDRLNRLILGGTSHGGRRAILPAPEVIAVLFNPEVDKLSAEEIARDSVPLFWDREFEENNRDVIERYIADFCKYPATPASIKSQQNLILTFSSYRHLPDIKAPTMVIGCSKDRIQPCENARLLAAGIPGAELAIIENAGHGVFIGDPTEKVSKIVLDFLHRHSKAHVS